MTTIIFLASLFALFTLVALRAYEMKYKKIETVSNFWSKSDQKIEAFLEKLNYKYSLYKKILHIFVFEFIPSFIYELLVKAKDQVSRYYYNSADNFRGRRVLRSDGSVSFFLERLGDDKKAN